MDLLSLPQLLDPILRYKSLPDQKQFRSLPASLQDLFKRDDRFPLFSKAIHKTISDVISKDAFTHSPA
jgi:hypothetical protein